MTSASASASASAARARPIAPKRLALVLVVFVSDLFLTGLVFGWAPLLLMLEEEGQYSELCHDESKSCLAQENALNLIFAVASVAANAGALPVGVFLDRAGPRVATALAAVLEVSGLVLLALADSQRFDVFVPAYMLIAFGGCVTMLSSFPASFLIMRYQTAILAAISCLFDGSSVVFLVLYAMRDTFGASRQQLFLGLAALAVAIYVSLFFLWGLNEKSLRSKPKPGVVIKDRRSPAITSASDQRDPLLGESNGNGSDTYQTMTTHAQEAGTKSPYQAKQADTAVFRLVDVAISKQMRSFEFAYIVIFAALQVLRATVYIGTTNKLLENYGDAAHGFLYTKVFSFVLPMGFLFVPSIDYLVETRGLAKALLFTNGLGVLYNLLVLVPSLPVQCLTFFVFTAFRAFLYAIMSAFTAKTFGLKNLGSLIGIIFTIASVVSLAEYPAVYITNSVFAGDLTALNVTSLACCLALFPFTSYLRKFEHDREQRRRGELAGDAGSVENGGGKTGGRKTYSSLMDTPTPGVTFLRSPGNAPQHTGPFSPEV